MDFRKLGERFRNEIILLHTIWFSYMYANCEHFKSPTFFRMKYLWMWYFLVDNSKVVVSYIYIEMALWMWMCNLCLYLFFVFATNTHSKWKISITRSQRINVQMKIIFNDAFSINTNVVYYTHLNRAFFCLLFIPIFFFFYVIIVWLEFSLFNDSKLFVAVVVHVC